MAAIRAPSYAFLSAFLPIARAQLFPASTQPITKRLPLLQRLRASATLAIPVPAALLPIPSLLSDLWDGILNAVPKKKTSHMKKRHRQMAAGKHLRDVTALNKCSACGRAKRAHVLCPFCVQSKSLPDLMELVDCKCCVHGLRNAEGWGGVWRTNWIHRYTTLVWHGIQVEGASGEG